MIESIIATVIGGIILLMIEHWTGWFSERAAFIRHYLSSDSDLPDMRVKSQTSRRYHRESSGVTRLALAEMVKNVILDSSKLDLIRHFINDIDVPISGEEAAMILSSFLFDSDIVHALEVMSPKLDRPVSDEAAKLIIKKISSSSSQAEAAGILSMNSNSFQRRRRR